MQRCTECRNKFYPEFFRKIDDQRICLRCLCGKVNPIDIWPIGVVRKPTPQALTAFAGTDGELSLVSLFPGQARFLFGLAAESRLDILWYCHKTRSIQTSFARGFDGKHVGPFASRTPDRLNAIAVSEVELLEIDDHRLVVLGLDAIAGSPIIDIKMASRT